MSGYIMDLLYKNKYFCDDIKNMDNLGHGWEMCLTKLQVQGRFSTPVIVEAIVIVFYKATRNTGLAFNPATTDFFEPFCAGMLAFLFAMIHCGMREYQSGVKVVRPFDRKIAQSMYYLYNVTHSHGCANINDRYIYTDLLAVVWLQVRAKTIDCYKAQVASHTCSPYYSEKYPRTDQASSRFI